MLKPSGFFILRSQIVNLVQNKVVALYVRVSTLDQNVESQTRALLDWCQKNDITNFEIFADHGISGAKESRPSLNRLMEKAEREELEKVVVFQFSRFARSTTHLLKALEKFRSKKIAFVSICESIDTNSHMGVLLVTILGALSQLERELIRERVISGLRVARLKGKIIGRKKMRNDALIFSLLDAQLSFREIARVAKCSHGSVSASKKDWLKMKAAKEAEKISKISEEIKLNQTNNVVSTMKAMNLPADVVAKVQNKFETEARANVQSIQGNGYETFD
jgi:DNA invertase Pin-like site-specific DNA recombinase